MVRGPISLVIASVAALAVIALVVAGPETFEKVLPRPVVAYLSTFGLGQGMVAGDGASITQPKGKGQWPSDYLYDESDGIVAKGPIAARIGNEPVFVDYVITGRSTDLSADLPAEVMTIRPILGCEITPPLAGSIVGHALAGRGGSDLALITYDDAALAAAVQVFVNAYRETAKAERSRAGDQAYDAYDVVVTETRGPVYLVLEARHGNRIWNIHLAEGARIERVILLGGKQAGVANLDPLVPVEVMLADGLEACGVAPSYPLNEGHLFFQSRDNGAMSPELAEEKLAVIAAGTAAYDQWFLANFGVSAGASRIGWDEGTMSVIGPVPGEADPRPVWQPITGAKIRTTQDTFFEIRGQSPKGTDFAARVEAMATTFAWGDLQNLRQGVEY